LGVGVLNVFGPSLPVPGFKSGIFIGGVFATFDGGGEEEEVEGAGGAGAGVLAGVGAAGLSFGALPVDEVLFVFFVLHPFAVVHLYEEAQVVVVVVCHKF